MSDKENKPILETIPIDHQPVPEDPVLKYIRNLFQLAQDKKASDIHLQANSTPIFRIDGKLINVDERRLTPDHITKIANKIMNKLNKEKFQEEYEIDFGYSIAGIGRYRVNIFMQRNSTNIVMRRISQVIHSIDKLHLPSEINHMALKPRGLILVTGTTGSGKSTTLAAMIDLINSTQKRHIITIEDPIEYLHRNKKSIISQREVGTDTKSFYKALTQALRQDPDVILVGEMRDHDTIDTALLAAQTGHLVMATLHTTDAPTTISRILTEYPQEKQRQIRELLSSDLVGIISQRLVSRKDGQGRVPAVELLETTSRIKDYIGDAERTKEIKEAIAEGYVQTFDQSLKKLFEQGLISQEEALLNSDNRSDFELALSGIETSSSSLAGQSSLQKEDEKETPGEDDLQIERF